MNKNRQIISELKDFFKHNDSSKAVNAVSNVREGYTYIVVISSGCIGTNFL